MKIASIWSNYLNKQLQQGAIVPGTTKVYRIPNAANVGFPALINYESLEAKELMHAEEISALYIVKSAESAPKTEFLLIDENTLQTYRRDLDTASRGAGSAGGGSIKREGVLLDKASLDNNMKLDDGFCMLIASRLATLGMKVQEQIESGLEEPKPYGVPLLDGFGDVDALMGYGSTVTPARTVYASVDSNVAPGRMLRSKSEDTLRHKPMRDIQDDKHSKSPVTHAIKSSSKKIREGKSLEDNPSAMPLPQKMSSGFSLLRKKESEPSAPTVLPSIGSPASKVRKRIEALQAEDKQYRQYRTKEDIENLHAIDKKKTRAQRLHTDSKTRISLDKAGLTQEYMDGFFSGYRDGQRSQVTSQSPEQTVGAISRESSFSSVKQAMKSLRAGAPKLDTIEENEVEEDSPRLVK